MTKSQPDSKKQSKWKETSERWKYVARLFKLVSSTAPKDMIFMLMITIVIGLIPLLSIFSLEKLVNAITQLSVVETEGLPTRTILWGALFIAALFLQSIVHIYGGMLNDQIQERIKFRIQKQIIEKTHRLSLSQFEDPELYNQLQRANRGLEDRLFSTMTFLFQSISGIITLGALLVYLLFIHWAIPVILFIGSVIFTLFRIRLFIEQYILQRKQTTDVRKLGYFEGLITAREAAREVRLYGLGSHLKQNWKTLNRKLRHERLAIARRESKLELISSTGNTSVFALVLTGIVYLATLGMLSVGQYAAFIRAVLEFQEEMTNVLWSIALIDSDLRYVKDFFDYIDLPEEELGSIALTEDQLTEGIVCNQVDFAYPGAKEKVLKNIDLAIKPGERIALVGHNGSGKTTLIKLLLGLYTPTKGRITVEGEDLQAVNVVDWRQKCTAIFQDFHKYLLPVKDNIGIGQIESIRNKNQIKKAAQLAGADGMIHELSDGYDTMLGKEFGGDELSQGQWQKVAIARAYMRDAALLILDEPTAALDPQAEVEVYRQFQEVSENKTTVFISHRLGICKLADRIIVLHEGEIAEQGTHQELIAQKGHYAKMHQIQSQWYA